MSFGDWLSQQGFRVTGGRRDPNSRLGRANPKSWHNQGALYDQGYGAFDVRPRKDMTFDQYRDRVKADGWNVREAIDEVNHPSKHATGPHWHIAVDGRKEQQPMASPLMSMLQSAPIYAQQPQPEQAPSLASYLQAPLTNEPLQKAILPGDQPGIPELPPMPGVKPKGRGTANDIMGSIFDVLAAAGGAQPLYWSGVVGQQQQQREEEADGRKWRQQLMAQRQAKRDDFIFEQDYLRKNPRPTNNDTAADYEYIASKLGPQAATRWLEGKTDPVVSIPLPGGQTYIGPRSGMASTVGKPQTNSPPQGAVDHLRQNPSLAAAFDEKYGAGSAAAILGGR